MEVNLLVRAVGLYIFCPLKFPEVSLVDEGRGNYENPESALNSTVFFLWGVFLMGAF